MILILVQVFSNQEVYTHTSFAFTEPVTHNCHTAGPASRLKKSVQNLDDNEERQGMDVGPIGQTK